MKKFLLLTLSVVLTLAAHAADVPSEKELKVLTDRTLLSFNTAVQKKDFGDFYKSVAQLWQEQTTPEKLQALFQDFIEKKIEFSEVVTGMEPTFEPEPAIDGDSLLIAQGFYPTKPSRMSFKLKYLEEKGAWKLVGISVKFGESGDESK